MQTPTDVRISHPSQLYRPTSPWLVPQYQESPSAARTRPLPLFQVVFDPPTNPFNATVTYPGISFWDLFKVPKGRVANADANKLMMGGSELLTLGGPLKHVPFKIRVRLSFF